MIILKLSTARGQKVVIFSENGRILNRSDCNGKERIAVEIPTILRSLGVLLYPAVPNTDGFKSPSLRQSIPCNY